MKDVLTARRVPKRKIHIHFPYLFAVLIFLGFIALMVYLEVPEEFKESVLIIPAIIFVFVPERIQLYIWHRAWRKMAKEVGIKYIEDEKSKKLFSSSLPVLEGQYKGHYLYISGVKVRRGKSHRACTKITMGHNEKTQEQIEISAKGLGSWHNLSRASASFKEYKINDKYLDKKTRVRSTDGSFAKKILSSTSLKQGLREIVSTQMRIFAGGSTLSFTEQGYMMDSAYLRGVLSLLDELSDEINQYNLYAPKKEIAESEVPNNYSNPLDQGMGRGELVQEKKKEKTGKKITGSIIVFLFACIAAIFFIASIGDIFWGAVIFLGILFVLFAIFSWDSIPGTRHYKSQRAVKELNALLRRELLPLGFHEERDSRATNRGFIRRDIAVDVYESKPRESLNFVAKRTSESPYYILVSVEKHFRKAEDFKMETKENFKEWFSTLEDEAKENAKGKLGHLDLL